MTTRQIEREVLVQMINDYLQKNYPMARPYTKENIEHVTDMQITLNGIQGCFNTFLLGVELYHKLHGINQ
jgi:hypothetical protein